MSGEQAAVAHLVALGYEDPLDRAAEQARTQRDWQQRLNAAQELLRAGQVDDALAALEELAVAAPRWAAPRQALAVAYFQASRWAAARRNLDWLEAHAVETAPMALLRATVDLKTRRFAAAIDQAQYARVLADRDHGALAAGPELTCGEAWRRLGEPDQAAAAYRAALDRAPDDVTAFVGLAATAARRGAWEEAVDHALSAVERDLRWPDAHAWLGVALLRLGRSAEARTAFEALANLSPARPGAWRLLAQACAEAGDASAAAEHRRRARQLVSGGGR